MKKILVIVFILFSTLLFSSEEQKEHKKYSAKCFNECWSYIEKENLSEEEVIKMLALSYASFYHWSEREDVKPMNFSIAYWQLGRIHTLAKQYEQALFYGNKVIELSMEKKLSAYSLGYGYEILARVYQEKNEISQAKKYLKLAQAELTKCTDKYEIQYLTADLNDIESKLKTGYND